MKQLRALDVMIAVFLIILLGVPIFLIYLLLYLRGLSPIFKQERLGRNKRPFIIYKFRTLSEETANVGTHELKSMSYTPYGQFLRRYKLDELPQLVNVLLGDMSFVGPRPCLPNQSELIELRSMAGIFNFYPGITGTAQIQGIDMSKPADLVEVELMMMANLTTCSYFKNVIQTGLALLPLAIKKSH